MARIAYRIQGGLVVGAVVCAFAIPAATASPPMLPVVACTGQTMTGKQPPTPPPRLTAHVRRGLAGSLALYSFNGAFVTAPRGWRCDGSSGSGGAYVTASSSRAGVFPAGGAYQPQESISAYVSSAGSNHPLFLACLWFAAARLLLERQGLHCGSGKPTPIGERQTHASHEELDFADPPHVLGTGNPSGGRNPAVGFVLWVPALNNAFKVNAAATATCVLPSSRRSLCTAVLSEFRVRFFAQIRHTS